LARKGYCLERAREGRYFGGKGNNMENRQIDKKSKQVRIDVYLHKRLKVESAKANMSIKAYLESYIVELLDKGYNKRVEH